MQSDRPLTLWSALRGPNVGVAPRVAASLIAGLVLAAFALIGAWVFAMQVGRGYVTDDSLGVAFAAAGVLWLGTLMWIWRGHGRGAAMGRAAGATLAVVIVTITGTVAIEEALRRQEEFLIGAFVLLAGAVVVLIWTPVVLRAGARRPVVSVENLVNVSCPGCGYSLIGLRELRCPECGAQFTIDGLIRAQQYEGVEKKLRISG